MAQNEIQFKTVKPITFQPQEIIKLDINFCANTQIVPSYELNEGTFLLISPQIHLDPILMTPSVCLYNTNKTLQILPENIVLFSVTFNTDTILNIPQSEKEVLSKHQFDKSIINYSFLQNMANTISKIACIHMAKIPIYALRTTQNTRKPSVKMRKASSSGQNQSYKEAKNELKVISDLDHSQANNIIDSIHLMHRLLEDKNLDLKIQI